MLTVCLHKLCVKDSLANAVRKVEKCVNIVPGGVENRPREGPKWLLGGLRRALGRQVGHVAAKAARKRNLGGSWVRLGRSWWLLGRSVDLPGRLEPPGTLLGSILASRGSHLGAFWHLFMAPLGNHENLDF